MLGESIIGQGQPSCWVNTLHCSFQMLFSRSTNVFLQHWYLPFLCKGQKSGWLNGLAEAEAQCPPVLADATALTCFWNGENTMVTAREVWGVCLPLIHAHLPYCVPYKSQKLAMTLPLPRAAKSHILLSVTSLIDKCPYYFPYFTWSTLHSQPALPCLFFSFTLHAASLWRHFPQNAGSKGRRAKAAGSGCEAGKGKFWFQLKARRINFFYSKELIVLG